MGWVAIVYRPPFPLTASPPWQPRLFRLSFVRQQPERLCRQPTLSSKRLLLQLYFHYKTSGILKMNQQPPSDQSQQPPPTLTNPRFTLELEFVSSLANPHYLSHLAVNYPNLLGISRTSEKSDLNNDTVDPEAEAFAAYLAYLYSYWKTPEYAQFLTHPGATLRALRLLQEDAFRRDIIRPQVIECLVGAGLGFNQDGATADAVEQQEGEQGQENQENKAQTGDKAVKT